MSLSAPTEPAGALNWGVWCEVSGGITGDRQAWLKSTGPGTKNPAVIARFTEGAARGKADDLNRVMKRNRAARLAYSARPIDT